MNSNDRFFSKRALLRSKADQMIFKERISIVKERENLVIDDRCEFCFSNRKTESNQRQSKLFSFLFTDIRIDVDEQETGISDGVGQTKS